MSWRPPLEKAILDGNMEKVKERLAAGNKVERDLFESNMLHVAVAQGTAEIVEIILSTGTDANSRLSRRLLYTPLHIAAIHNRPEIVKLLIERGAVIDAEGKDGTTPFLLAIEKGNLAAADALVASGANVYKRGATGDAYAYAAGNADTIKYLNNLFEM
jgi:ankyrin repeat protein